MNMVTNRFVFRVVEVPKMPTPEMYLKVVPVLVEKAWSQVKSQLSGLSSLTGLKLGSIKADSLAIHGRLKNAGGEGPGRLEFDVALHNLSLEVWVYYPDGSPGAESLVEVAVPKEVEEDLAAFRAWSEKNWKAAKALSDLDKSAKLKADDPARGTALKAMDAALKDYYATF